MTDRETELLELARGTIAEALRTGRRTTPAVDQLSPQLRAPGAAFVTLRTASTGALRGCIGSLEAHRPLGVDVAAHALDAAFRDPRFPPLQDLADLRIDICVLGELTDFPADSYDDLVARIPVGSGLLVTARGHRGTFLPTVWQELPQPAVFVAQLWRKAGLAPGSWPRGIALATYSAVEFSES